MVALSLRDEPWLKKIEMPHALPLVPRYSFSREKRNRNPPDRLLFLLRYMEGLSSSCWLSLSRLWWIGLAVDFAEGLASASLALWDRVHDGGDMIATTPPG